MYKNFQNLINNPTFLHTILFYDKSLVYHSMSQEVRLCNPDPRSLHQYFQSRECLKW